MTSSTVRIGCEIDPIDARTYYSRAYLFAILIFPAQVIKAEADAQHLWYTRRAGTLAKSELIAAIYDKALKRRDYSGIIKKDEEKEKENAKEGEKKKDGKKRDSGVGSTNVLRSELPCMAYLISTALLIGCSSLFFYSRLNTAPFRPIIHSFG